METENQDKKRSFWKGILTGAIVTGCVLVITFAIFVFTISKNYVDSVKNIKEQYDKAIEGRNADGKLITRDFEDKVESIYNLIKKDFLFTENIDEEKMRDMMIKGVVKSLDDIYSEYYTEEEFEELMSDSAGEYCGVGSYVTLDSDKGMAYFSNVFKDSPAMNAGIRDGDYIYSVDDTVVVGYELNDIVALVKGEAGTDVVIKILRDNEYIDYTVTRNLVTLPTVTYEMKDDSIGYIFIQEFDTVTVKQYVDAYNDLKSQGMKAMILDLRANPGGNLDTVLAIADYFLPEGMVTYMESVDGTREEYNCKGEHPIDIPLAVLVNGYTASAAELLSGAIKDYKMGTIIGTQTFGKGIAQQMLGFKDGTGLKYTDARYYIPSGVCINKVGVTPDIVLEFEGERYYSEERYDNQLEYAKEFLKDKLTHE